MSAESLTPEQEAQIEPYRQRWFKIGTSTEPLDLVPAMDAVGRAYQAGNLEKPKFFFAAGSPISAAIAGVCLQRFFRGLEDDLKAAKTLDGVFLDAGKSIAESLTRELTTFAATDEPVVKVLKVLRKQEKQIETLEEYVQRAHIKHFDKGKTLPLALHDVAKDMAAQLSLQLVDAVTERDRSDVEVKAVTGGIAMSGKSNQAQYDKLVGSTAQAVLDALAKRKATQAFAKDVGEQFSALAGIVHLRVRDAFRTWVDKRLAEIEAASIPAEIDEEFARGCQQQFSDQANGNHDTSWSCYYDFLLNVCQVKEVEPLKGLLDLAQVCGWWTPLRWVAILQHRPAELHCDSEGRLHRDGGMVVRFRDGFGFWILHGVPVPKEVAETPSEKLDPQMVLKTQNADVRREILRKIGMERFIHKVGASTLHEEPENGYALIEFPIGNDRKARALKMANPSVEEVWHVECVPPTCTTVQDALNFRNGFTADQIDPVNGAEWLQQGDVIIKPKGATKFKPRPSQLT